MRVKATLGRHPTVAVAGKRRAVVAWKSAVWDSISLGIRARSAEPDTRSEDLFDQSVRLLRTRLTARQEAVE